MRQLADQIDLSKPALVCEDVKFEYQDGIKALQGIDLTINEKEKVGIIGPNGAGKSTFLSILNGVRKGKGNIYVYGIDVTEKNYKIIRKTVGLVFQNPDDQLFCPTIFEDIAFGPLNLGISEKAIKERVHQVLKEVGLSGFENRSSIHISFGEKKLASIASILSMDPSIVALDEPTSNLDHAHRRKIINWIKKNERTILITSHDLDLLLETCSRVVVLNSGKKVADGPVHEILSDAKLLEKNNMELPLSLL